MTPSRPLFNAGLPDALMGALYDLPLVPRPWDAVGQAVGETGGEIRRRVEGLFRDGFIRDIGPIFNAHLLGYRMTLAAGKVPADRLDATAEAISAHPGVSHNYLRDCEQFNIWFTLAVPGDDAAMDRALAELSEQTGQTFRRFDTLRRYKISFRLSGKTPASPSAKSTMRFEEFDSDTQAGLAEAIAIFQKGLSAAERPFLKLAEEAGTVTEDELLRRGEQLRQAGLMRRFGVTWRHRELGLRENVLCVWRVPESQLNDFADRVSAIPSITHCYRRQTWPDWPWAMYTMIHGKSEADCRAVIDQLQRAFPEADYLPLRTVKEYKKTRVIYLPAVRI